jgi:hypothetical protein
VSRELYIPADTTTLRTSANYIGISRAFAFDEDFAREGFELIA